MAGENPDDVKVVKTAPTGKAAFNIKNYHHTPRQTQRERLAGQTNISLLITKC